MSGKLTKLAVTQERDGTHYAFGHISARREEDKVYLVVASSPQRSTETPALSSQDALHASDALRAAAANASAYMCAGKSLHQLLWEELMTIMDRLMTGQEAEDGRDPGRAEGTAYCIAIFQNPYAPNIEAVRAEALERWEADLAAAEVKPRRLGTLEERAAARRQRRTRRV